jgi:hypothetical protein
MPRSPSRPLATAFSAILAQDDIDFSEHDIRTTQHPPAPCR